MPRPFAVIGFTMLFTLAVLFFLPEWVVYPVLCAAALGLAACLVFRKRRGSPELPAAFGSVLCACVLLLTQLAFGYYPALQSTGESLDIRARVVSNAEAKYGRYYYQVQALSVDGEAQNFGLRLSAPYALDCESYDEIAYIGTIFMLGEDDPEAAAHYKAKGVWLGSYAESFGEDRFEVIPKASLHPMRYILRLQRAIARNLDYAFSGDAAALLRGMLLGDVQGLRWAVQEDFRQSGTSHIFSVSGMHMSLLAWSLFKLLRALKCPQKASSLLSAAFVIFFMALTGFSAPCVRAGVMMLVLLAGELFSRRADSLNSLGLAATLLMLVSPLSAGQLGLQLSFGATLGIVLFQGRFTAPLRERCKDWPKILRRAARFIYEGLGVTIAALVPTVPVQLLRLPGGVSLMALPANLVQVPLSSLAMVLGGVAALLPEPLRGALAFVTEPLCRLLLKLAQAMADLPAPVLKGSLEALISPLVVCIVIAAIALLRRYFNRPMPLKITAGICTFVMLLGGWLPGLLQNNRTEITRLETGQGISVLVSRGRKAALLGCDGDELPAGAAKNALSTIGARGLELFVLPGNDAGAVELRRDVAIKEIISAEGVAEFALWEGADGIFYKDGKDAACLLRTERELVVIRFSGEIPVEWREVERLGDD